MFNVSRRGLAAFALSIAAVGTAPAHAQQKPVIKVSSLTLPVFNPLVWNIMKARGLDVKNGFELDAKAYPSISAFYAAFATGETDVLIGGPTILQKLYQEGVPVRIIGTGFTLSDLVIFTKNDKIKSLADLKGKQLAVDMGGSQFQVTKMYAAAKGLDLGKDIIVVNANFAVARAQLEAGRVDAALVIEPLASIIIKQNPDWKRDLQRCGGLEGNHRHGWLGNRHRNARGRDREGSGRAENDDRGAAGCRQSVIQNDTGGGGQNRQRDAQASAGHPDRGGDGKRLQMIDPACLGAGHPQVDHRHDGARGEGGILRKNAGREDHLCTLRDGAPFR